VTDLAISSPAGFAVRVDRHGVADGVVAHEAVARHLTSLRQHNANPDANPHANPHVNPHANAHANTADLGGSRPGR
jgi:hypothetical protein